MATESVLTYVVVLLAVLVGAPAAFTLLAWVYLDYAPPGLRRLVPRRRRKGPDDTPAVFHQLELTRLADLMQRYRSSHDPGAALRLRAATAAYDDRLVELAELVGVEVPSHRPPLADAERFDVETRLVAVGAHW